MVTTRAKYKKTIKACLSQASMGDSDQQSTQSGAIIGSNDDLLTEILLRLPVTSILRFKSVSKHWRLLLSDRHFTLRYDKLSKSPGLFADNEYVPFDVENPSTPPFRSLDFYFDRPGVRILQSCNGLLLCCTNEGPRGGRSGVRYYVFNPTTKQLAVIPPVPGGRKVANTIFFMGLAFDQKDCVHYKVFCILSLEPGGDLFQIQLYSSDTRKWKTSIQSFYMDQYNFNKGVYWNGAVYLDSDLLYFKLDVEQLQTLSMPVEMMSSQVLNMYLEASRGHLHLIAYETHEDDILDKLHMNVYEMFSDHSGWFVKYHVELDALPDMFFQFGFGYCFSVIDVVRGEEEEDTFLVVITQEKIITYNVHDKSFKHIFSLPRAFYEKFHRYTETLSSF